MRKIDRHSVFENQKYMNILRVLDAYPGGLTLEHIAYVLIGKKKLIEMHYISKKNVKTIENHLKENKEKEYEVIVKGKNDTIQNPSRLSEYLWKLCFELEFVYKTHNKKYRLQAKSKTIMALNAYKNILNIKILNLSLGQIENYDIISHIDKNMLIFSMRPEINRFIHEKYAERLEKIVKKFHSILKEVDMIRLDARLNVVKPWLEKYEGKDKAEKIISHIKDEEFMGDYYREKSNVTVLMNTYDNIISEFSDYNENVKTENI